MDKFKIISKKWINLLFIMDLLLALILYLPESDSDFSDSLSSSVFSESSSCAVLLNRTVSFVSQKPVFPSDLSTQFSSDDIPDPITSAGFSAPAASSSPSAQSLSPDFSISPITEEIKSRILGISYPEDCPVPLESLCYLTVLHIGFDGLTHQGELIVHERIAETVLEIFLKLYLAGYPIEKIRLIDEYNADDEASMADNNTSAFCCRPVAGTDTLSAHSYGLAIDINPLYNPYIRGETISPADSPYDRETGTVSSPYFMTERDYCVQLFLSYGFTWGGSWDSPTDFQHFEYERAAAH